MEEEEMNKYVIPAGCWCKCFFPRGLRLSLERSGVQHGVDSSKVAPSTPHILSFCYYSEDTRVPLKPLYHSPLQLDKGEGTQRRARGLR